MTKQLGEATNQLADAGPSDEVIHEARKSIKKVRAVLQLLRDEVGTGRDRKRLRRASRLLSPLRDADAMLASAKALCGPGRGRLPKEACAAISDILNRHKERLCRAAEQEHAAQRAAKALERIRRSAKAWPWKRVGFAVVAAAIKKSYKNARREMETARDRRTAKDFHEWRKRVKTLWYALRLLEESVPRRRLLADLERLETWLGEDHNFLTLRTHVLTSRRLPPPARVKVKALSERRQAELRRRALSMGARVFKATPKAFIRPLQQQWRNRHDRPRPRRRSSPPALQARKVA